MVQFIKSALFGIIIFSFVGATTPKKEQKQFIGASHPTPYETAKIPFLKTILSFPKRYFFTSHTQYYKNETHFILFAILFAR